MFAKKDFPATLVDVVAKYGHKILFLTVIAVFCLSCGTTATNLDANPQQNCTWKYYCIAMNDKQQCTELSMPEILCGTLEDQIIDVATRCPPGQAHDFRGKCRKIFT